jgi:hypothetical protein
VIVHAVSCPHPPLLLPGVTGGAVDEVVALRAACVEAVAGIVAAAPDLIAVVGAAPGTRTYPPDTPSPRHHFAPGLAAPGLAAPGLAASGLAASGLAAPAAGPVLPLSLAVGVALLREAGLRDAGLPPDTLPSGDAAVLPGGAGVPVELHGVAADLPVEGGRRYGRLLARRPERIALLVLADGSARRGPAAPGYVDDRAAAVDGAVEAALRTGDPAALLALDPATATELLVAGRVAWQVLAGACERCAVLATCHYSDAPFGVWYPVVSWRCQGLTGTTRRRR